MKKKKLNLGCGDDIRKGWDNVDVREMNGEIQVLDLNKFPYPYESNTYDELILMSVIEHLKEPIKVLLEVVRICKNKAKVTILVPHAYSYEHVSDLQHRNNFTENTFKESSMREYGLEELHLLSIEHTFYHKWKRYIPFKKYLKVFLNGIYDGIKFEFEVVK